MPERARPNGAGALVGVLAGMLAFLVVVLLVVRWGEDQRGRAGSVEILAEPTDAAVPADATVPTAPASATQPAEAVPEAADATPAPASGATDREPTDADAAAFIAAYEPPGGRDVEAVAVDLDDDGRSEVVVASVAGDVVRLDVAVWDTSTYVVAHTDQGGPAEELVSFEVRDLTGDGVRDILTAQVAPERESIALWGWDEETLVRHVASGGCWDGSHVYGDTGAEVIGREIHASCPPIPDEVPLGTRHVYVWNGEAWTHEGTE